MSLLPTIGAVDQATGFYKGVATQSLRFDDGSSAYLTRTPDDASNRRTFTWSGWVKRCSPATANVVFSSYVDANNFFAIRLRAYGDNGRLEIIHYSTGNDLNLTTTQVIRDVSAWYNIVVAIDTTQGTDTNRAKVYINGSQVTDFSVATYPSQNFDTDVNIVDAHYVGSLAAGNYHDGYLSDVNFIDGLQLTPTSFGETKNGVWIPINTSGLTFGTNGFRLKFKSSDFNESGSAITDPYGSATDVPDDDVADASGKGNHFSVSGLVTSDFGMLDSPENNFATLNVLDNRGSATIAEGSLKATLPANSNITATIAPTSGKWYWECYLNDTTNPYIGVQSVDTAGSGFVAYSQDAVALNSAGDIYYDGGSQSGAFEGSPAWSNTNILSVAYDVDNNKIWWALNGQFYSANASSESTIAYSVVEAGNSAYDLSSQVTHGVAFLSSSASNGIVTINFGQDGSFAGELTGDAIGDAKDGNGKGLFKYAPPSGYLALCTANLPEPNIGANSDTQSTNHFGILTWSGDNDARDISVGASGITGTVDFTPDWAWIKRRNGASNGSDHLLIDSVRGVNGHKGLSTNGTAIEGLTPAGSSWTNFGDIVSFKAGGFNGSASGTEEAINQSGGTYVAWNWKAGGTPTATNSAGAGNTPTAGSVKIDGVNLDSALAGNIPATKLSANTIAGFSIVTYTGTGSTSSGVTIAHGLGKTPVWIITKKQNAVGTDYGWSVWHQELGGNYGIWLDKNAARNVNMWDSYSNFSSTVFGPADKDYNNVNTATYVNYVFAEIEGYSKFGKYTGNNAATDGTFVHLGFRPAWIMIKRDEAGVGWFMYDTRRSPYNTAYQTLFANGNTVEGTYSGDSIDMLSNGFKIMAAVNRTGLTTTDTYIYMAFAESPFKYANAR